jgi:hypothetical protein
MRIAGIDGSHAGNVATLLADRCNAAQHHIVYLRSIELSAIAKCLQCLNCQLNGRDFMQATITSAFAAWRAHMIVDIGISHELKISLRSLALGSGSSFPRRRESRTNKHHFYYWIPAYAGMTASNKHYINQ